MSTATAPDRDRRSEEGGRVLGEEDGTCRVCGRSSIPHPSHACRACRAGKPEDWVAATRAAVVEVAAPTLEPEERHGFDLGRLCGCGCGGRVYGFRANREYASVECRVRAQRARDAASEKGSDSMGGGNQVETSAAEFKCEECDRTFQFARGLGSHRRIVHGVLGTGHGAVARRRRAALIKGGRAVKSKAPATRRRPKRVRPATSAITTVPSEALRPELVPVAFISAERDPEAFAVAVCLKALSPLEPSMRAATLELVRLKFSSGV